MFEAQLPRQINALQFAQQGKELSGSLPLKSMMRLIPSLLDDSGKVAFNLRFGIDEEGIRYIRGRLTTRLQLLCQRCLKPMEYDINDELVLGIILSHAQAQTLPKHYEPLLVTGEPQELLPLIEDELIVRLPIVAMHENEECKLKTLQTKIKADNGNNPFTKLSQLK